MRSRTARLARVFRRAAATGALCGMMSAPAHAPLEPAASRRAAPEFVREDAAGAPVRLADLRGKVVLLNFWATWCHGCQEEIPWFVEYAKTYGPNGLTVVGASIDREGWKIVRPYLEKKRMNDPHYAIVIADEALQKNYAVDNLPVTVLIDRNGRVAATYSGVVDRKGCEAEIQTLLQEKAS
jgi:cytochrome c biogenesis protein CcmG/thiol:disulfide interchange protein DsbE